MLLCPLASKQLFFIFSLCRFVLKSAGFSSWISSFCFEHFLHLIEVLLKFCPPKSDCNPPQLCTVADSTAVTSTVWSKLLTKTLASSRPVGTDLNGFCTCQAKHSYTVCMLFHTVGLPAVSSQLYSTTFPRKIPRESVPEANLLPLLFEANSSPVSGSKHSFMEFGLDNAVLVLDCFISALVKLTIIIILGLLYNYQYGMNALSD